MEEKDSKISEADLAAAFKPEKKKKSKSPKDKKKVISIIVFAIGIATLITGVVFLIMNLVAKPGLQDGEYLVSAKQWILDDSANCNSEANCESGQVAWRFTEIGKGILTTNNHLNDYDFIWAIEDGKLKIETNWLYELENEYQYDLDQRNGFLTLHEGDKEIKFVADFATE